MRTALAALFSVLSACGASQPAPEPDERCGGAHPGPVPTDGSGLEGVWGTWEDGGDEAMYVELVLSNGRYRERRADGDQHQGTYEVDASTWRFVTSGPAAQGPCRAGSGVTCVVGWTSADEMGIEDLRYCRSGDAAEARRRLAEGDGP